MSRDDGLDGSPPGATTGPAARVVLYGRAGCHLCDEAREVVRAVCAELSVRWAEVDVDGAPPGPAAPHLPHPPRLPAGRTLAQEYGELVPVVEVDGVRRGYWRIDAGRLRRALAQVDVSAAGPDRP